VSRTPHPARFAIALALLASAAGLDACTTPQAGGANAATSDAQAPTREVHEPTTGVQASTPDAHEPTTWVQASTPDVQEPTTGVQERMPDAQEPTPGSGAEGAPAEPRRAVGAEAPATSPAEHRSYEVDFRGNATFGAFTLRKRIADELRDFERRGYRKSAIDDAAYRVEEFYRSEGFSVARCDYELEVRPDGHVVATLSVEEGPRTELDGVSIEGSTRFERGRLRSAFFDPPRWFGTPTTWFARSKIDAALGRIRGWYRDDGYADARVELAAIDFSDDLATARIRVTIEEGLRYRVASVELATEDLPHRADLQSVLDAPLGAPFTLKQIVDLRSALRAFYAERGHADAEVSVDRRTDTASGAVHVTVTVVPGPEVVVDDVHILGLERTRSRLVRNRLTLGTGDTYRASELRRSFRRLFATGLFSKVDVELAEGDGPRRDLLVDLEEGPSREVYVEPGWGSYELFRLKTGFRDHNLFGMGRTFRTEGIASTRHLELEVGVSEPFLFGSDVYADLSARTLEREEPSFTRESTGVDLTLARRWTPSFETAIDYQFRLSGVAEVKVVDPNVTQALETIDVSAIEVSAKIDTSNGLFAPTRGARARLAVQWGDSALGSELDFLRTRYSQGHFLALAEDTTLALSFRAGAIFPTHDSDAIPLQERFFNGGENTVRSFRQDELGPVDASDNPVGGETFSVVSVELRQRLAGNLSGAFFVDGGNVAPDASDFFEFADFRWGIGVGIRYMLPIGPLRLDGAVNPDARSGEDDYVVHFSVGLPF